MTSFTDIYKQELKSKGVMSSLGSTALKRIKERLDPRNMLFGGAGMIASTGQKIFGRGYSAIPNNMASKLSPKTTEVSGPQNDAITSLLSSSLKQESQLAIIAKNTMNSNMMARDMNVMRQNMMKLVTMGGGKASRGADMFFKDAKTRENEYESKFKKDLPTGVPTAPVKMNDGIEKNKSLMSTIIGGAISAIGVTIKTLSGSLALALSGIKGILSGLLTGFNVVKNIITSFAASQIFSIAKGGLSILVQGILAVMKSPVVLGILAALVPSIYTLMKAKETGTPEKDATREVQLDSNKNAMRESKNIMIGKERASDMIAKEQNLFNLAQQNPRMLTESVKKESADRRTALSNEGFFPLDVIDPATKKKQLLFRREFRTDNIGGMDLPAPSPTTPEKVSGGDARVNAEQYLGRSISDNEFDMLIRAAFAESSNNAQEYANVIAVILNRARKTDKTIFDVLMERDQFQAVTGTSKNPGPNPMYIQGPSGARLDSILKSTENLKDISTTQDTFTAANRAAYKEGTNVGFLDKVLASGGKQIGQTVFAENLYRGRALSSASVASNTLRQEAATQSPPVVNVNTQTNNSVAGGKGATPQVASATNIDALDLFFKFAM